VKSSWVIAAGLAAAIGAWIIAPELSTPARAGMAFLIGIFPALALLQARATAQITALPSRVRLYLSTMAGLWMLTFAIAFVASESGFNPRLMGVTEMPLGPFALWTAISLIGVSALVMAFKAFGMRETPLLEYLVPQTIVEKIVYVGVSLTAGLCEEFVFRGFLIGALRASTGSIAVAATVSAVTFGIAHAHQNAAGALRAGLLALVLTVPLLMTGSLYPGIAAHALVDLAGGLWLSRWLLRS
jgi:uncharacterized protein